MDGSTGVCARELAKWRAIFHGSESSIGGGSRIYRALQLSWCRARLSWRAGSVEVPTLRWRGSVPF